MIVENKKNGVYFKFDKQDWKYGAVNEFLVKIKKIGGVFNPVEKEDDNWWYVPLWNIDQFEKFKLDYIDRPVETELEMIKAGFKPIPKVNRKFQYKRAVR